MHSEHFRTLLAAQLELKWRALREQLEQQGAAPELTESIEHAVIEARPPIGRSGRAVVASADGVLVNEHLIRPAGPVVRVSPLPYIVPVVEHGIDKTTYAVVIADHDGADITLWRDGTAVSDTVDGDAYPVHKASNAESAGYGDPQRTADGARQQNIRAVAAQLAKLVDDASPEIVFVVGEVLSRSDLAAEALPTVAIATDASLVRTDERIAPEDGIAALLRYVLP
jgi:hypothetical protein